MNEYPIQITKKVILSILSEEKHFNNCRNPSSFWIFWFGTNCRIKTRLYVLDAKKGWKTFDMAYKGRWYLRQTTAYQIFQQLWWCCCECRNKPNNFIISFQQHQKLPKNLETKLPLFVNKLVGTFLMKLESAEQCFPTPKFEWWDEK